MNEIKKRPIQELGTEFIPSNYIPQGKDEYYLRYQQNPNSNQFRQLNAHEIEILVRNHNTCSNWNSLLVSEAFNPELVKNNKFFGLVRIGKLESIFLEFNDLAIPVGIYNSIIINCDLGDNIAIDNVNYMAYYITGNEVIITNVNEITTTNHAKFGNGILTEGEAESIRIKIEICNENGGRSIIPFDGMQAADAWLWSRDRQNENLQRRYREMTEKKFDNQRGYYGTIGDRTVIKNCSIIKDVKIGSDAYLKGANKLKNLTINSLPQANTQIGEGCELVNGIIGAGCRIFYGVKAVRFILGSNSQLKYGARLINSFLADNATISCCEVLNSLIFPYHEQHHNNSFLIASTLLGQSNIAAGATLGSNHNSRAADGEMIAGRGFWPALCTSIKHNSRFAPFTILAKGNYAYEMDITFPFSLVSNDDKNNSLNIRPAYWLQYNLFALERNAWKYNSRDNRIDKSQFIETHYLAPDTVNTMFTAATKLKNLFDVYFKNNIERSTALNDGKEDNSLPEICLMDQKIENSKRNVIVLKPAQAYQSYIRFIEYYAMHTIFNYLKNTQTNTMDEIVMLCATPQFRYEFENIGGQFIPVDEMKKLKAKIENYEIVDWEQIHAFYAAQSEKYTHYKLLHAIASLQEIEGTTTIDSLRLKQSFEKYKLARRQVIIDVKASRDKDYTNHFRKMLYNGDQEMEAVMGNTNDIPFILELTQALKKDESLINDLTQLIST